MIEATLEALTPPNIFGTARVVRLDSALFLALVLAHILGDFVLQTNKTVQDKGQMRPSAHVKHALLHAALTAAACLLVGSVSLVQIAIITTVITAAHLFIDILKETLGKAATDRGLPPIVLIAIDQAAHLAAILVMVNETTHTVDDSTNAYPEVGPNTIPILILVTGMLTAVWVGAAAVRAFMRGLTAKNEPERGGADNAGTTIGMLERALMFILILSDLAAGVGFLIAAKSILRFGDIAQTRTKQTGDDTDDTRSARAQSEYILIGTLASFTWGILIALLTQSFLQALDPFAQR